MKHSGVAMIRELSEFRKQAEKVLELVDALKTEVFEEKPVRVIRRKPPAS